MSNPKRGRLWSQLTDYAKWLIEENYSSCNLKDLILDEIDDVVSMGISPNWGIIEAGFEKCVEQARGLAKKYDKDVCYYLQMSFGPGKRWFYNYVIHIAKGITDL
jgi:hypothetical protein